MNYRERMKEYLKEPNEYSSQYGKWGLLNKEQRDLIKRLLREMDNADEVIKHQYFEIERLNNIIKEVREYIELVETLAINDKRNIFSMSALKRILDKGE